MKLYYPRSGSQQRRRRPRQASMCSTSLKLSPYFAIRQPTRPTHSRKLQRLEASERQQQKQRQKQRRRRRAQNVFYGLFKCLRKQRSEADADAAAGSGNCPHCEPLSLPHSRLSLTLFHRGRHVLCGRERREQQHCLSVNRLLSFMSVNITVTKRNA